jgi:BASS family bile acid:Na+ symporter
MEESLDLLTHLMTLVFAVSTMMATGMSLKLNEIIEPLKDGSLVLRSLLVNFVLVPLFALLIIKLLPLKESIAMGLLLLAFAPGEPVLPKLAKIAKVDVGFSVGLAVLLMIGTIFYLPLVFPLFVSGLEINTLLITKELVVLMLLPLVFGLVVNARYQGVSKLLLPTLEQVSNITLILVTALLLFINFSHVVGLIGTFGILAMLLLFAAGFGAGYLFGGPDRDERLVLAMGTPLRNIPAPLLVATQNFDDPNVAVMVVVASVLLVAMLPVAGEIGRLKGAGNGSEERVAKKDEN